MLREAVRESPENLFAVGGVGVEISTTTRTALIPDFAVLSTGPVTTSFDPSGVVLAGEIWSPGNTLGEQQEKRAAYAYAKVPYFWSVTQDERGPVELTAYRLQQGRYAADVTVDLGQGDVTITAGPVPVDVAALRP